MFEEFFGGGGGGGRAGQHHTFEFGDAFEGLNGFGGMGGGAGRQSKNGYLYAKDSLVRRLSSKKYPNKRSKHEWLIQFYSAKNQACVKFIDHFETVAEELSDKVKVGAINCDKHAQFCQQKHIKSFPTFFYVWKGKEVPYEGELEDDYLLYNFAITHHLNRLKAIRKGDVAEELHAGSQKFLCDVGKETRTKASSVMCVIFVLSKDSKSRKKELTRAHDVAKKLRESKFKLSWIDAKTQHQVLQKYFPTLARTPGVLLLRMNVKRKSFRIATLLSLESNEIETFVDRALGGDVQYVALPGVSSIDFK